MSLNLLLMYQICPTSSMYTNSATLDKHAIHDFARDNVSFSLNTDDPGVMHCSINEEYKMAHESLQLTRDQIKKSVSSLQVFRVLSSSE